MNHFNKGIIFGKVTSAKEDHMKSRDDPDTKIICANIQCVCPSDFGTVRVFAKVMREELAAQFLHEENQGKHMRLEGFFAQYRDRNGEIKSNYNIFEWSPLSGKDEKDMRAVFILVGELLDVEEIEGGWYKLFIQTVRETSDREFKNEFTLYTKDAEGIQTRQTYRFKGELRGIEDRFGDVTGTRAVALEIRTVNNQPEGMPVPMAEESDMPF